MLTERRERVLRLLLTASGPVAAAEIGRSLDCPARVIRYDLAALEDWVVRNGARLVSAAGIGYQLTGDLPRVQAALDQFVQARIPVYEYVLSPRERVRRLLLHLLGEAGIHTLQALAGWVGVGKSTVHSDLVGVEVWADARRLTLERTHSGVRLVGAEAFWRQAMLDLILELADEGQFALMLEGHPEGESLAAVLKPMLPHVDWPAVGNLVGEVALPELGVHLAVMVSRLTDSYTLTFNPEQVKRMMGTAEWRQAQALAEKVESTWPIRVPSTEVAALALFMQGARLGADEYEVGTLSELDLAMARSMASLVQTRLGLPIVQDREFVMGLALHLRPIQHRLRRGRTVENPLLDDIRTKYAAAYRAAADMAHALEATWSVNVPPGEIGYLALHIAAAIERVKLLSQQGPRILVVCGAGIGTAQLLATRLRSLLPQAHVLRITSVFRVRKVLAEEPYDLVVSTCQLADCQIPVVRVSPLLTDGDFNRIQHALRALHNDTARGRQPVLREVLKPDAIALDIKADSWEEAVRAAGTLLVANGAVEERYVEAMIRTARDLGPYIVLGPGFALPHARPEDGVKALGIAMVRLQPPVCFGHPDNDPVDLVFALAAVDHETHLKALMQLSDLLGNPQSLAALRTASDTAAVYQLIEAASALETEAAVKERTSP